MNIVVLQGTLARSPQVRASAMGHLVSYEVTTRTAGEPALTVPVAWSDPPSGGHQLEAGQEVTVVGRVRRRFFRAGGATHCRTEVAATAVIPSRRRAQVHRAVRRVLDELAADLE